jgi:hypothetical protein
MKIGVNGAIFAIETRWPIFKVGLLNWILKFFIGKIGTEILNILSPAVAFTIIKFDNEEDRQTYDLAVASLKQTLSSGDQDAIDKASKKFNDDFDKLISFGGH